MRGSVGALTGRIPPLASWVALRQVLEENTIVSEVTFSETATGASVLQGQFISAATGTARRTCPPRLELR